MEPEVVRVASCGKRRLGVVPEKAPPLDRLRHPWHTDCVPIEKTKAREQLMAHDPINMPSVEPDPVTPGSHTSEFFITLASIVGHVVAFVAILWKLSPEQSANLQSSLTAIIGAAAVLVTNATVIYKFIESRRSIKTEAIKAAGAVQAVKETGANEQALQSSAQSAQASLEAQRRL